MKCAHCSIEFHPKHELLKLGKDRDAEWCIFKFICPKCDRMMLILLEGTTMTIGPNSLSTNFENGKIIYPRINSLRPPCPNEVPDNFSQDYKEACDVIELSPKASAALSRRCLQNILREKGNIKNGNLANEIQQVLDSGQLPSTISDILDAVRNVGNFAAHPIKSQSTGEIIEVDIGEAELNLDVIEALFDFYFVQPEKVNLKKNKINKKLKDAGKPPIK